MAIFNTVISGGGTTPTGTIQITTNGTHDVTNYATADVQVPTTAPAHYIEYRQTGTTLYVPNTFMNLSGITDLGASALAYAFAYSGITTADMSSIQHFGRSSCCTCAFYYCSQLTSVDLSSLQDITANNAAWGMFSNCTSLTSIAFPALTRVTDGCGYMFGSCSSLASVDLGHLVKLDGTNGAFQYAFDTCRNLTNVDLSSLTIITGQGPFARAFNSHNGSMELRFPSITPSSFGTNTYPFSNMFNGVTNGIIHFPSNLDPASGSTVISSLNGYPNFGGTNTTILYDLPATNTLTGADTVTYTRNPKYDTGTALAWKVGAYGTTNFTPAYYTSGLTDPTVGTTIYSDAACTTVVTTVDTVA